MKDTKAKQIWLVYRAITKLGQVEATTQKEAIAEARRVWGWGTGCFTGVYLPDTPILAGYDRMKAEQAKGLR